VPARGNSLSAGEAILENNGGFVFLRPESGESPPVGSLPVAINLGTQALGAVTGVVVLKMASTDSAAGLAADYQLKPIQIFDSLKLGYFQSGKTDPAELTRLLQSLRQDDRVAKAELEILDKWRVAQ
jgi:hypothetical protein